MSAYAATALRDDIELDDDTNRESEGTSKVQWSSVIPAFGLSSWQKEAVQNLLSIANLPQNWDSYGSLSPLQKVVDITLQILLKANYANLTAPNIVPVSGGGIQIEWSSDSRELELEVLPNGIIEYLKAENHQPLEEGEIITLFQFKIRNLLVWLLQGRSY